MMGDLGKDTSINPTPKTKNRRREQYISNLQFKNQNPNKKLQKMDTFFLSFKCNNNSNLTSPKGALPKNSQNQHIPTEQRQQNGCAQLEIRNAHNTRQKST